MRIVVDSNSLQSPELEAFFAASADNRAVITEYASMEAYKGDTLNSIFKSMSVLARHSKQVIILKATNAIAGLTPSEAVSPGGLVDAEQTRGFPQYCAALRQAERGDAALQKQLLEMGREATEHIDGMLDSAAMLAEGYNLMAKEYSDAELKIIRRRAPLTPGIGEKVMRYTLLLAALFFQNHPAVTSIPKGPEVRDAFIFRFAVCAHMLILKWIEVGGAQRAKTDRLRNDVVDVNFAAYATYFDGLLSSDVKAMEIYAGARYLLENVFVPPGSPEDPASAPE